MGSIILKLEPAKLTNPDLDIRYLIPTMIEALTNGEIVDNGYMYDCCDNLLIYLKTTVPRKAINDVLHILKNHQFKGNALYGVVEIYLSDKSDEELENLDYDIHSYEPCRNRFIQDLEYASKRLTLVCRFQQEYVNHVLIPEIETNCVRHTCNSEIAATFSRYKRAENSMYFHHLYVETNIPIGIEYDYMACLSTIRGANNTFYTRPIHPIIPCKTKVLCFFTNYKIHPIGFANHGHHENCLIQFQDSVPEIIDKLYEINENKQIDYHTRICLFSAKDEEYKSLL